MLCRALVSVKFHDSSPKEIGQRWPPWESSKARTPADPKEQNNLYYISQKQDILGKKNLLRVLFWEVIHQILHKTNTVCSKKQNKNTTQNSST